MKLQKQSIEGGVVKDLARKFIQGLDKQFQEIGKNIQSEIKDIREDAKGMVATIFPSYSDDLLPYEIKIDKMEKSSDRSKYDFAAWLSLKDPSDKIYNNVLKLYYEIPEPGTTSGEDVNVNTGEGKDNSSDDFEPSSSGSTQNTVEQSKEEPIPSNTSEALANSILINEDELCGILEKFERVVMTNFPGGEATAASTYVKLEKITSTESVDISLKGIFSSTYTNVLDDNIVYDILEDDQFFDSVPEGETTYCITDNGDDLNIDVVESPKLDMYIASVNDILAQLWNLKSILIATKCNIKGIHAYEIQCLCDNLSWEVDTFIDKVVQLLLVDGHCVPNMSDIKKSYDETFLDYTTIEPLCSTLNIIANIIQNYKVNFTDVQLLVFDEIYLRLKTMLAVDLQSFMQGDNLHG